jgi:hypothetical protein
MLEPIGTTKSNTPSLPPKKNNLSTLGGCMLAHVIGTIIIFCLPVFFGIFSLAYWQGHEFMGV